MSPDKLQGSTIVITGVTGQVARPLATALARDNRVIGAARFSDAAARAELETAGVECVPVDLVSGDMGKLPEDAEYVLHFAVAKTNDWERDLAANSGGLAYLMEHHRGARAFLHCSSTAVYKPEGHRVFDEEGPLGDNHGVWPFLRTYSICKIAAEGTARWGAERFALPTTIARLSVPYGDNGGWPAIHLHMMLSGHAIPVHVDAPSVYHPLHADDILAMVPRLLAAASVPAVTVNWGGSEPVSIEEWCAYLAGLAGTEARFEPTEQTIDSVQIDTTRMHELAGQTSVSWRDGMRRMAKALHPDRVL
jgi:UDP-glucuronate 4-epimerase